jgi:(p)ppGpp synthase/HD superfamily hydrolase
MLTKEKQFMELAKRWMPGKRKGGNRRAWHHPQDVVLLLKQMPTIPNPEITIPTAWLHDVLEDGMAVPSDRALCELDLAVEGVPQPIRDAVKWLTCTDDSPAGKAAYLRGLMEAPIPVRVVKAADRIVNLHEGYYSFGYKWFIKYTWLTAEGVIPFVMTLPEPYGPWLSQKLEAHMVTAKLLEEYKK